MKKKANNKQKSEKYTLTISSNGFATISLRGFGILLPDTYSISEAVEALKDAKSAQDLFFNNFKNK